MTDWRTGAGASLFMTDPSAPSLALQPAYAPTDPLYAQQWYLLGGWGAGLARVWNDYRGTGSLVAVFDDGVDHGHADLAPAYRTDLDLDVADGDSDAAPNPAIGDRHGTAVAGVIAAADNGAGTVGVAFDAGIFGVRLGFNSVTTFEQILDGYAHARTVGADVLNNSWGAIGAFYDDFGIDFAGADFTDIAAEFVSQVSLGRGGLGASIVFSGGNDRATGDNVNYHNLVNSPFTIAVAALDSNGTYASFSTPGAALLVSAGGSSIQTTDIAGPAGYSGGDYTIRSGTSFAAPIVSGIIALILEANPELGYRDVQQILAMSARRNDPGSTGWQTNGATHWNGGGQHFSHDYGYGAIDALTAVRLAESWDRQQTYANLASASAQTMPGFTLALPATGTVTTSLIVAQSLVIDHVLIDLAISHAAAGELVVTLISPAGTESRLVEHIGNGAYTGGIDFTFSTVASLGENAAGTWQLRITDSSGASAGILDGWSLTALGSMPTTADTYIYTNEFAAEAGLAPARQTLHDSNGGIDTLNTAAISDDVTLNLNPGATNTLAGGSFVIAPGTVVENIRAGDGHDRLTGNAADNDMSGGRGNDTLFGKNGADVLAGDSGNDNIQGGAGDDTVAGGSGNDVFHYTGAGTSDGFDTVDGGSGYDIIMSHANGAAITLAAVTGIEKIYSGGFADVSVIGGDGDTLFDFSSLALVGITTIDGGDGNDSITGSGASDTIKGGDGNDILVGRTGLDTLSGGNGDDVLSGGGHADTLAGGNGADIFVYDFIWESRFNLSADTLTDFEAGLDRIDLSALDADAIAAGDQAFSFIGTAALSGLPGELRLETVALPGQTLLLGELNGWGTPDLAIILANGTLPTASDFLL